MEEQRVTDELYKIAVEKGFVPNKTASMYVVRQNGNHFSTDGSEWKKEKPTLSLLQKWIREEHEIHIEIYLEDTPRKYHWTSTLILSGVKHRNYIDELFWDEPREVDLENKSKTYEEALEFALQETLKII